MHRQRLRELRRIGGVEFSREISGTVLLQVTGKSESLKLRHPQLAIARSPDMIGIPQGCFTLLHDGERIGTSNLERGDPAERSASGVFYNIGGAKALAGWIQSIGGAEDEGVTYVAVGEEFELQSDDGQIVAIGEATLIAVPETDETFLELSEIPESTYATFFADHIAALGDDSG